MKPIISVLAGAILVALIGLLFGGLRGGAIFGTIGIIVALFELPAAFRRFKEPAGRRAVKYDDAEFHDPDGNLEEDLAAAHIALFLRWCDQRDLISERLRKESEPELAKARTGATTYTAFLLNQCDGKLLDEHLSEEGNRFAAAYYEKGYLVEYVAICGFPNYSRRELDHDYPAISTLLDRRLADFRAGTLPRKYSSKRI